MSRKPKICKEVVLASSSVVVLVIVTVLTSFITCGFDLKKMFSGENTFNLITNASITVMGIVSSLPLGILTTKQRLNPDGSEGRYLQDFHEFHSIRKLIEPKRKYFGQWHSIQYAKECKTKQFDYLLKHNVIQPEYILLLSVEQVRTLTKPRVFEIDGKTIHLNALTPSQIKACIKVLEGKVQVRKLPDFYFLYVDNVSNLSFYDTAYTERKDEVKTVLVKILSKVALGFVVTCVLTGFAHDLKDVQFTPTYIVFAILLMLIRIFNALSSVYAGLSAGQEVVYRQCYYINGKTQFLKSFDTDTSFNPDEIIVPETHVVKELTEGVKNVNTQ